MNMLLDGSSFPSHAELNKERKVLGRKNKEIKRGKHFYANHSSFSQTNTDLPEDFCNQVLCGDSEDLLKTLPDNCIDLVFTSPPYNFGLDYEGGEDSENWPLYFEKLFRILDECARVLKHGGRLIVNVQPLFSDYIPSHHIISRHMLDSGMIWKGEILWEKNNYNCKYRMGKLEKSIQSISQIHLGIYRDLLQGVAQNRWPEF